MRDLPSPVIRPETRGSHDVPSGTPAPRPTGQVAAAVARRPGRVSGDRARMEASKIRSDMHLAVLALPDVITVGVQGARACGSSFSLLFNL